MESYRITIIGKVQAVYYRKFVSQALMKMGMQGYIRNLKDGSVEIVARLYDDDLNPAIDIIKKGSPLSEVEGVKVDVIHDDDIIYDGFEIRY